MEGAALLSRIEQLREQARQVLDPEVWRYLETGADAAGEPWQRLSLRPHILRGVTRSDAATTALGQPLAVPVMIAPTGRATRYAPEGELALLAGAEAAGSITLLPSSVVPSLAKLRVLRPNAMFWQQLYWQADRCAMRARLNAIREAGGAAVVLTVDLLPDDRPAPPAPARATWEGDEPAVAGTNLFTGATIDDLAWLCGEADLPVVVKGVLRGDDAEACIAAGAAALIVSNHGGNQLDGAIAPAEALSEIVAAAGERTEVYVDGGIRSGASVLKALALGARAVLVGRPASYALAAAGADGVAAMLGTLGAELERAMILCGVDTLAEIDRTLVA